MSTFFYVGNTPTVAFAQSISAAGHTLQHIPQLIDVHPLLKQNPPRLIILDLALPHADLRNAIISLLLIDARVHCAVVTDMAPQIFHDAMEGLGILMSLPPHCTAEHAQNLLTTLNNMPC